MTRRGRGPSWCRAASGAAVLGLLAGCAAAAPATGLERSGFRRPSTPEEIVRFLAELGRRSERVAFLATGRSAGGRPLAAAVVGRDAAAGPAPSSRRLTVMLVGSQHGNEPSGGEALQLLAREVASGRRAAYLEDLDLVIVPDANPDGRAACRRGNARDVNLSTAFVVSAEPETRAVLDLLHRRRPDVVLDVHESAILKPSTLARQGYVTDVEAQLERPTNPDVDPGLLALSERILADAVARIAAAGLPAQRYLGEITDLRQPITRGGPSLNNLRNMAGMYGALSLLLENRLDPRGESFPTPRNIRARVQKQLVAITAILDTCREHRAAILAAVDAARRRWRHGGDGRVHLAAALERNPRQPEIVLPLRRLADGAPEQLRFELRDVVEGRRALRLPRGYAVTAHQEMLGAVLDRHRVAYEPLARPVTVVARAARAGAACAGGSAACRTRLTLPPGALWIDLLQPARRLIPLLVDPASESGIFRHPEYARLIAGDPFVYRVDEIVGDGSALQEPVRVMPPSEPNEPGSESGKRSADRGGVAKATPHKGGASTPLAAPGSFGAAGGITRTGD